MKASSTIEFVKGLEQRLCHRESARGVARERRHSGFIGSPLVRVRNCRRFFGASLPARRGGQQARRRRASLMMLRKPIGAARRAS
jgi:hypothetical protein